MNESTDKGAKRNLLLLQLLGCKFVTGEMNILGEKQT